MGDNNMIQDISNYVYMEHKTARTKETMPAC